MPYYTGTVASYSDLLTAVYTHLQDAGWTLDNGILSKNGLYLALNATTGNTPGITAQGGTGQNGAALLGASPQKPRIGALTNTGGEWGARAPSWPCTYHVHVLDSPDEVYILLNTNVVQFYYLAFGAIDVPGCNGMWITATSPERAFSWTSAPGWSDYTGRVESGSYASYFCPMPFWATTYAGSSLSTADYSDALLVDGAWSGAPVTLGAATQNPLGARLRATWTLSAPLMPFERYQQVASNRVRKVLSLKHARIASMMTLEEGTVLELSPERWKVYPMLAKNLQVPDGGSNAWHSGAYGWAIRYDGD